MTRNQDVVRFGLCGTASNDAKIRYRQGQDRILSGISVSYIKEQGARLRGQVCRDGGEDGSPTRDREPKSNKYVLYLQEQVYTTNERHLQRGLPLSPHNREKKNYEKSQRETRGPEVHEIRISTS
jgi:hypothetical protein